MTKSVRWKEYEKLVAQVQQSLSPDSVVTWNDHIYGHRSQKMRQVDVSVRVNLAPYSMLVAMDCKDYGRPVNVKDVEASIGLFHDIQANKGVVVSNSGFTNGARNVARQTGIDLLSLVDAQSADWTTALTVPVLYDCKTMELLRLQWEKVDNEEVARLPPVDLDQIQNTVYHLWNDSQIPAVPGWNTNVLRMGPFVALDDRGSVGAFEASVHMQVKQFFRMLMVPVSQLRGLKNAATGDITAESLQLALPCSTADIMAGTPVIDPSSVVDHELPTIDGEPLRLRFEVRQAHHTDITLISHRPAPVLFYTKPGNGQKVMRLQFPNALGIDT